MDRRLFLEFLPGAVFLLANAVGGIFFATAMSILAAGLAIPLRYRIDGQIPFIALATVALSVGLLAAGLALDDAGYIKIKPTIGGVLFAGLLAVGYGFRPSLLRRSLGYKLRMTGAGWRALHAAWIALALALAALNEIVWRSVATDTWVAFNAASGPVTFALYWLATDRIARWYWRTGS